MKKSVIRFGVLLFIGLTLTACFKPKTPQDVASAFWEAVVTNNANNVVEYSTLTDTKYYDNFSKDWKEYQPSFGKITIEDKQASVVTKLSSPANSGLADRNFTTFLVKVENEWQVDYDRTKSSIHGGAIGELFGALGNLGGDLSKQMESSSDNIKLEMDRMARKLQQITDSLSKQASKTIDIYSEQLRSSIKELEELINRALKEEDKNLSDDDKHSLREISADLGRDKEIVSEPNFEAVTRSSINIGEAELKLDAIDNDSLVVYKKEWRKISGQLEEEMGKMINKLYALPETKDTTE